MTGDCALAAPGFATAPVKSVAYNVMLARLPLFGVHKRDREGIEAILERVGLTGRGKEMVSTLSGCEKQRVGLA
jgi:putative ABC transport system ATP-binding protein